MDVKRLRKGDILAKKGGTVENLWLIMEGNAFMKTGMESLTLGKGDFIGLADIVSGVYSCDYEASSDLSVKVFAGREALLKSDFLSAKPDSCRAIALCAGKIAISMNKSVSEVNSVLKGFLELVRKAYLSYREYAISLHATPKELEAAELLPDNPSDSIIGQITARMHTGMYSYISNKDTGQSMAEARILPGYILYCSKDISELCPLIEEAKDEINGCIEILMNESEDDLYGRLTSLYMRATADHELAAPIMELMEEIYDRVFEVSPRIAEIRKYALEARLNQAASAGRDDTPAGKGDSPDTAAKLVDSCDVILEYCDYPADQGEILKEALAAFRKVADPLSMEDDVKRLRSIIEEQFYQLYLSVLTIYVKSRNMKEVPVIVRMFLNFGYLDENLLGMDKACELYNIALTYEGAPSKGIYTAAEWLKSIFKKEKEPSINEFDQTFEEYVKDQRNNGNINDAQVKAILNDRAQKVVFELQNMFRKASRICSGQILAFCPVLTSESIIRGIRDDLCDHNSITDTIDRIRAIDFSVFYRETMFVYSEKESIYDSIHVEVRPDVILMPVAGSRSVMWQEIVGKDRLTPGRFMFPVIATENLDKLMLKTLGEFRWELCKRIQGARWNDVTEASITSLYCDYLQFYRKNSELSAEQKEKIKTGLQRFKQVYKDYFVNDYSEYIRYESTGSPHLNKTARSILYMLCPFSSGIRLRLASNPIYSEVSEKYRIKCGQQLHKLENIQKKLSSKGNEIPRELKNEITYYNL